MGTFKIAKDFSGKEIILTLEMKEECKDKNYDLYTVCKVIYNEYGERELTPLYSETFTPEQVEEFYNNPTYYLTSMEEQENV